MPRLSRWLLAGCTTLACLVFFGPALFQDEQFAYRDAAHFYYPLYQRVEQEWNAGRVPLWEPEENSGMPLLGNPTAAVLYPPKLIYRLAPSYAWGARLYTLFHTLLAVVAMFALARGVSISPAGAALAALGYAFGAPILFQYCNIIYLVGAAWLPLGLRAADAWLRQGKPRAIAGLAVVLAMQTLGGDPQAAYLTGLFTAIYAWILSRPEAPSRPSARPWILALLLLIAWFAITIAAAAFLARPQGDARKPLNALPFVTPASLAIRVGWLVAAAWFVLSCFRSPRHRPLGRRLAGLLAGAFLAILLSAAQLLPVLEFTSRSARSAESGPHDFYPFSLEPARLAELAWPDLYGSVFGGNTSWLRLVTPNRAEVWVPSLYLGMPILVLALAGMFGGRLKPVRRWFMVLTLLATVASLGRFASPIWIARFIPALQPIIGTHDSFDDAAIRFDGYLRDGDGGLYWMLATFLPGFGGFRYPSKLFTFVAIGLAVLAGFGFDRLITEGRRRLVAIPATVLLALSATAALALVIRKQAFLDLLASTPLATEAGAHGPFAFNGAWQITTLAFAHSGLVSIAILCAVALSRRHPRAAVTVLLATLTLDLALANRSQMITIPQSVFDEPPAMLARIEAAEREQPTPGGMYRVHRTPVWSPQGWGKRSSEDRHREFTEWERLTLQPKYAIPYGMEYVLTEGVAELYDYVYFFAPFDGVYRDPNAARMFLGQEIDKKLVAFPRRGYDLWNTRYFLLPYLPGNDEHRGFASFLPNTDRLAPLIDQNLPDRDAQISDWAFEHDWQLLRNHDVYPRAWVVHDAVRRTPIQGLRRKDREELMYELLYQNDPLWTYTDRPIYDPRRQAWIETDDPDKIVPFISRMSVQPSEAPRIVHYDPQRVELEVDLQSPGFVILADIFYPGWTLTIDGQPAPVLRANRMMRGAGVPSGKHRLVYRYQPQSFLWGLVASTLGLVLLGLVLIFARRFQPKPAESP